MMKKRKKNKVKKYDIICAQKGMSRNDDNNDFLLLKQWCKSNERENQLPLYNNANILTLTFNHCNSARY